MKSRSGRGTPVSGEENKPPPGGSSTALKLVDVTVSYGRFIAVERATFSIDVGECVAMVGPNGSGKSSIGMACAGRFPPPVPSRYLMKKHREATRPGWRSGEWSWFRNAASSFPR